MRFNHRTKLCLNYFPLTEGPQASEPTFHCGQTVELRLFTGAQNKQMQASHSSEVEELLLVTDSQETVRFLVFREIIHDTRWTVSHIHWIYFT